MMKNAIFDLDGTIIFSHEDVLDSLEYAYQELQIPFTIKNHRELIGPPLAEVILKISPNLAEDQIQALVTEFKKHYDTSEYKKTILISGIKELLSYFLEKKIRMFIATNKRYFPAKRVLGILNLFSYFEDIITPDKEKNSSLKKEAMIQLIIDKYQLNLKETVMIGDTEHDIYAAHANNISSIGFVSGYGDEALLRESQPTKIVNEIIEIKEFIQKKAL